MAKNIWIITGEPSGETYGLRLARELRGLDPGLVIRGMGTERFAAAGIELIADADGLSIMGFVEVLRHLPRLRRVFNGLLALARREPPDAVVLIDYPGFNLRLAEKLNRLGIRVIYYISPQDWAWGRRRIPKIARIVDKMLVIFPFEPQVYAGTGLEVEFVGHPLVEVLQEERLPEGGRDPNLVLLLPGSRHGELRRLLPTLVRTAGLLHGCYPALKFVMALPNGPVADLGAAMLAELRPALPAGLELELVCGRTLEYMQRAACGIAASGTVTVEAAILGLPLVVAYRLNPISHLLARALVRVDYFTMVNLVAGRLLFEEFLQGRATPENLAAALEALLPPDGRRRQEVEAGMREVVEALGGSLRASHRAALSVLRLLDGHPGKTTIILKPEQLAGGKAD